MLLLAGAVSMLLLRVAREQAALAASRALLRATLDATGEGVLVGPGENAGVMDVGDGIAAAIRIESHNHPSYIEPYNGAATGVGGILRDVFTMGARPIANLNALRFGAPRAEAVDLAHLLGSGLAQGVHAAEMLTQQRGGLVLD